jgi:hypothetical protein
LPSDAYNDNFSRSISLSNIKTVDYEPFPLERLISFRWFRLNNYLPKTFKLKFTIMKKMNLVRPVLGVLLNLFLLVTSCTKEAMQKPTENNVASSSVIEGQALTASQGIAISATNAIASPDIGYNLIASGLYYIQARSYQGLALDVPNGSVQNGVLIQQYNLNMIAQNQWWYVTNLGNGYYSITTYRCCKSLDIPNSSTAPGVKVQQYDYHGGLNQQWRIATSISTGLSRIYNRRSGLALDVPNASTVPGVVIQQFTPHSGANQTWYLRKWDGRALF